MQTVILDQIDKIVEDLKNSGRAIVTEPTPEGPAAQRDTNIFDLDEVREQVDETTDQTEETDAEKPGEPPGEYTELRFAPYPTPPQSPPSALLAAAFVGVRLTAKTHPSTLGGAANTRHNGRRNSPALIHQTTTKNALGAGESTVLAERAKDNGREARSDPVSAERAKDNTALGAGGRTVLAERAEGYRREARHKMVSAERAERLEAGLNTVSAERAER